MFVLVTEDNLHKQEKTQKRFNKGEPNFADQDFVRVTFQNRLKYRSQGLSVLSSVRKMLNLNPSEFAGTVR